ncbi:uncharacterized protein LOC142557655 isoform X2 [Dermacentor variabilis]|uniref:uncharacterized protein LOC142557655 isoform X2 n=1 Tax=Dermacentor variabilis TaxID=34621 RepID=UPI003F5BA32D
MARSRVWTTVAAACVIVTSCVLPAMAQTCSLERSAQCRDDLMRQVRQESRSFRGQEIANLCRSARDNMACLMWHSANCQSRDQQDKSGDVILSAKSFLDRSCDLDGGWRVSRCFQYDDVKQCEANFVAGGKTSIVTDSCRSYVAFKRCVKDVAGRRCSVEEERQLSSYLVDRARELSWQCGASSGEARDVHSIYRSGSPSGYAPYTQDSYCMLRASEYIQDCSREHQKRQYNARRYHSDDRVKETCCATLAYRECIKVVLHDQCRDAGSAVIDNILYQQTRELDYECRDFNAYRCSGCIAKTSGAMLLAAVALVLVRTVAFGSS